MNVLVDNGAADGAPVIVERNPTYYNLFGRIEYRAAFGAMVTDFREIKPGALHRRTAASSSLDVLDVLRHPFAWDALKRALRAREIAHREPRRAVQRGAERDAAPRADPARRQGRADRLAVRSTTLLYQLDDDFRELFKVKADFSPELDWTPRTPAQLRRASSAAACARTASVTSTQPPSRA